MHRQPSLFGVEATDPAPADLAGLLAGPGRLGRMGGTARISVVVDGAWRVHVLVAELVRRGLTASWQPGDQGRFVVRSAYSTRLAVLAAAWSGERGEKRPPTPLFLGGHALRLWVAAAGSPSPGPTPAGRPADAPGGSKGAPSQGKPAPTPAGRPANVPGGSKGAPPPGEPTAPDQAVDGYELQLSAADRACWPAAGAALVAAGLPAELRRPPGGVPAYLITGRSRLELLAELVGPPPAAAPPGAWPAPRG